MSFSWQEIALAFALGWLFGMVVLRFAASRGGCGRAG